MLLFLEVYSLLKKKQFKHFEKLLQVKPLLLSSLRNHFNGETLLMEAAWLRHIDVFEYLLRFDIDLTTVDERGNNVVFWIVTALVDFKTSLTDKKMILLEKLKTKRNNLEELINHVDDIDGNSSLHHAARLNRHELISFLLANNANVNKRNAEHRLPEEQEDCDFYTTALIQKQRRDSGKTTIASDC